MIFDKTINIKENGKRKKILIIVKIKIMKIKIFRDADVPPIGGGVATSFNDLISRELIKFDEVVPKVDELAKEFLPLKIKDVNDIAGYDEVSKSLRFMVGKRTAVEAKRKELKRNSIDYGNAVDARASEIVAMLAPIEKHLRTQKEEIDRQKQEIELQKEIEKQEKIRARHDRLIAAGMGLVGSEYVYESESYPAINLETLSDEDFEIYFTQVSDFINAEKKKKQDELDRQKKEKEDFEKQQALLKEEQDNMMKERFSIRESTLFNLGFIVAPQPNVTDIDRLIYSYKGDVCTIMRSEVLRLPLKDWEERIDNIKRVIASEENLNRIGEERTQQLLKIGLVEKIRDGKTFYEYSNLFFTLEDTRNLTDDIWNASIENIVSRINADKLAQENFENRLGILTAMGLEYSELTGFFFYKGKGVTSRTEISQVGSVEWNKKLLEIKFQIENIDFEEKEKIQKALRDAESEKIAKQKALDDAEAERIAGLNDSQKIDEYIAKLNAVPVPDLKTKKARAALMLIRERFKK